VCTLNLCFSYAKALGGLTFQHQFVCYDVDKEGNHTPDKIRVALPVVSLLLVGSEVIHRYVLVGQYVYNTLQTF
jgi:hypothetical protein